MLKKLKSSMSMRLSPTQAHLSGLRADFRARLRGFRSNRTAELQSELVEDFSQVLQAWGIEDEKAICGVLRDMRLRCLLLILPVVAVTLGAVLSPSFSALLTVTLVVPSCVFGLVVTLWRMTILQRRKFTPLWCWLTRFIRNTQQRGAS
jgi:hypothetical protein